jgi:hypothetical protein
MIEKKNQNALLSAENARKKCKTFNDNQRIYKQD